MQEKYKDVLFKDSHYAKRFPIGKKEILEDFDYETLKRYYKEWYRPDLMAVVVVGDVDVADMEAKVKEYFGRIEAQESPKERKYFEMPDHKEVLAASETDKESTFTNIQLSYKHEKKVPKTEADYRNQLLIGLYNTMLNQRLEELKEQAEPPFIFGSTSYGSFVRTKNAYRSFAMVPETGVENALRSLVSENERVLQQQMLYQGLYRYN